MDFHFWSAPYGEIINNTILKTMTLKSSINYDNDLDLDLGTRNKTVPTQTQEDDLDLRTLL